MRAIYFFSTDKLFKLWNQQNLNLHSIGSSSLWLLKKNTTSAQSCILLPKTKRRHHCCVFRALQEQMQQCSRIRLLYRTGLLKNFPGIFRQSASDTAISSYILTPQGQIAAHSDSSLVMKHGFPILSKHMLFWTNANSFFKDNQTSIITAALWTTAGFTLRKSRKAIFRSNTQVLIQTLLITVIISLAADNPYCNPFFQETDKQNCLTVLCHGILSSRA